MTIVCYGDSNTWGYDPRSFLGDRYPAEYRWPELLSLKSGWCIVNLGYNGLEIPTVPFTPPQNTDILLIMLGTNDLLQGCSADEAAIRMGKFLEKVLFPADRIILIAPPAMRPGEWVSDEYLLQESTKLPAAYEKTATVRGVRFINADSWNIPMCFDGVHFTEEGHFIFAEALLPILSVMT